MPYSLAHKEETNKKIVESARILFNRHGFVNVTIDMVMENAGLTRGGFYNHFKNKEALYSAAVSSFLMGRGAEWREEAGVNVEKPSIETIRHMMKSYLSSEHLGDLDGQCPMIALPSDVARAGPEVQTSYQDLLEAMIWLFEHNLGGKSAPSRKKSLSLAALCIGGMVVARTLPNSDLAEEIREAAFNAADEILAS